MGSAAVAHAQPLRNAQYADRCVVIVPENRTANAELRPIVEAFGGVIAMESPISGVLTVVVPPGHEQLLSTVWRAMPGVKRACRNPVSGSFGMADCDPVITAPPANPLPTDSGFSNQWYLENTGQVVPDNSCLGDPAIAGTPGIDINIRGAWGITQGCRDVVVAVLDTGVWYENPDFDPSRFVYPDLPLTCPTGGPLQYWDCCTSPGVGCNFEEAYDTGGHGTLVAGIVCAKVGNGSIDPPTPNIAGVDPSCGILSARVGHFGYTGGQVPWTATLQALEAIASNAEPEYANVRVINMSYTVGCAEVSSQSEEYDVLAIIHDAVILLHAQNRVIVGIAGNGGTADHCPGRWPEVIQVAGINQSGLRHQPSCSIGASGVGPTVDFAAPGRGLFATPCESAPCQLQTEFNSAFHANWGSGTSGAAPQVAGIVSLMFARAAELDITLTFAMVYDVLRQSARPLPAYTTYPNNEVGHGLVDAQGALETLEELYYTDRD